MLIVIVCLWLVLSSHAWLITSSTDFQKFHLTVNTDKSEFCHGTLTI